MGLVLPFKVVKNSTDGGEGGVQCAKKHKFTRRNQSLSDFFYRLSL